MNRRCIALATFAVGGVTLLAACTAGSDASSSTRAAAGSVAGSVAEPVAGPAGGAAASSGAVGRGDTGGQTSTGSAEQAARVTNPALIVTGSMTLVVRANAAVDTAATRATGIADAAGGRVDADNRSSDGQHSATLVLRVPNASLPSVRRQLAGLGTVRTQDLQTRDVTGQVADVNSRVTSARAAIAGLDRLYAQARTVRDLITVESALAGRQSDLESLETQQRTLSAQTSLATITLSIGVRAAAAPKHHHHRTGFAGGVHAGWHAFTSTARALAVAVGAVLPFAALAALIAAGALFTLRRRRRARPSAG